MNDTQFHSFLDLLMVSDPWPLDQQSHRALLAYANAESGKRGFDGWYHAYHESDGFPDERIVAYSYEDNVVEIELKGTVYQFVDVPDKEIAEWVRSEDAAEYYQDNIRGQYRYVVEL